MHLRFLVPHVTLALLGMSSACAADLPIHDVKGSHDHRMFTRFTGSVIGGYQQSVYHAVMLPLGSGHIALYGIQFASDGAKLTADPDGTLIQMASLLKAQPNLKVYIVGHTDNTGALAHNLALSQQRAEAVTKALVARSIASDRMSDQGLASYAPVTSNRSDAGKGQNRRVELVEQ